MLPTLYCEYEYNTICHKNCIKIHSLVYRLGYHEAIILIITQATIKPSHCCFMNHHKEFGLHPICGRKGLEDSKQGMNTLEGSLCTILTAAAVCIMDHVGAQTLRFTKICC